MGIQLASILGLLLLAPGFCISLGMRIHSNYGFQAFGANKTSGLIFIIIAATILQIIIFPLYVCFIESVAHHFGFNIKYPQTLSFSNFFKWDSFNYTLYGVLSAYVLISLIVGYFTGKGLIKYIESGHLSIPYFHGSMYPLVKGKRKNIKIVCSILTNIEHNGCFLMYKGTLEEISYITRNKLDYVSLSDVSSFVLKIDPKNLTTTTSGSHFRENKTTTPHSPIKKVTYYSSVTNAALRKSLLEKERFFINGEDIVNILFSRELALVNQSKILRTPKKNMGQDAP
tara:strand:+ start:724 stop:1578 length:855 start_codon:yes stop_codon:yes gene_type:complete